MLPDDPSQITAEWLTQALRVNEILRQSSVTNVQISSMTSGAGLTGQIAKIILEYDIEEAGAPRSIVAKLPPIRDEAKSVGVSLRLFEREHRFYCELGSKTVLRIPRCYYSDYDARTAKAILLLEDFSFGQAGDQLVGWTAEQAALALQQLAKFHAQWWEHPALNQFDWMPEWDSPEIMEMVAAAYQQMWPAFVDQYGENLPPYVIGAGEGLASRLHEVAGEFTKPPHTVTHGDFRMDNLFFDQSDKNMFLGVIDWQLVCRGRGVFDLGYFMSQSGTPDQRRMFEKELLEIYHGTLKDQLKQKEYGFDEMFEDYRRSVLYSLVYPVVSSGGFDVDNDRAKKLIKTVTERVSSAMIDLDVAELLPT